jgi:predicted Zn-dependent peptidase
MDEAFRLAQRYFEDIPAGSVHAHADTTEQPQTEERRGTVEEKFGTLPAVAIGYRTPARRTPDWYAAALLDQALHGGRAGRIYRKLVLEQQLAVEAAGDTGDPFDYNGPTQIVTRIIYKPEVTGEQLLAAYDALIEEVRQKGIGAEELEEVKVKFRSDYYSSLESGHGSGFPRYGLMHYLACLTLFDGDPNLINTMLDGFMAVTAAQVRAVAEKYLAPTQRAIVFRLPGQKVAA